MSEFKKAWEIFKGKEMRKSNSIPKGNAQLVYGINGDPGETFEVTRTGTMLPVGKYRVVDEKKDSAHSGMWGSFSNITVEKI